MGFNMNNIQAFINGEANRNKERMVFDWNKAVEIIKDRNLQNCAAGLDGDFGYTAGIILSDGKPYTDDYTYLASTWAKPQLIIMDSSGCDFDDCETIDCFVMEGETKFNESTKFPQDLIDLF